MKISEKYSASLDAKRDELMAYVRSHVSLISLPSAQPTEQPVSESNNSMLPIGVAVAGGIVLVAGLALSKTAVSVLGGIALVGGAIWKATTANKGQNVPALPEIKYYAVTKKVYDALSAIQKHAFDEWNNALLDNKSKLKAEIGALDIDEAKKNAAIQSILTTSVFDLSMSKVSSSLNSIEQSKDINAYKQYLHTFEGLCKDALDNAVDEQKKTYSALDSIL